MTRPIITHKFRDHEYSFHDTVQAPDLIKEIFGDNYDVIKSVEAGILSFPSGSIILDIGANEGMFSILMATLFPQTRIIALEPVSRTFFHLVANKDLNGCSNIECYNVGVGKPGQHTVKMVVGKNDWSGGSSSLITYKESDHIQMEVGLITLDKVFEMYKIDRCRLMKMDIEGMEHDVLYSSTVLPRVDYMTAEFHINNRLNFQCRRMDALAVWCSNLTKLIHVDFCHMAE